MRIICLTSNAYVRCLPAFAHQWNKYWGQHQHVTVAHYDVEPPKLPPNFLRHRIGAQADYTWSGGLMKLLMDVGESHVMLFLEDYWLKRDVNLSVVLTLYMYMREHQDVGKIDLTDDRQKFPYKHYKVIPTEHYVRDTNKRFTKSLDLIEALQDRELYIPDGGFRNKLFLMSFQAAIWRTDFLLRYLDKAEDPWHAEVNGTARIVKHPTGLILGTLKAPVAYINATKTGKPRLWRQLDDLDPQDKAELCRLGYLS